MDFGTLPIIILPFALLVIVLSFGTLNRFIRYKERVALARLGFSLEDMSRAEIATRRGNRGVLWGGVITAMRGLALLLGLSTMGVGAWLLGGLLPLFVGLGMVLIYFVTSGAEQHEPSATERRATPEDPLAGSQPERTSDRRASGD